jgi:hypothetical protein
MGSVYLLSRPAQTPARPSLPCNSKIKIAPPSRAIWGEINSPGCSIGILAWWRKTERWQNAAALLIQTTAVNLSAYQRQ